MSDAHGYAQRTRFLPEHVAACFRPVLAQAASDDDATGPGGIDTQLTSEAIRRRTKGLW